MMPSTARPTPQAPGQAPMGAPAGAGGGQQGQPNPEEVKAMLIQIIAKARELAEQNGIDFQSLVAGSSPSPSVPPPPRPPM